MDIPTRPPFIYMVPASELLHNELAWYVLSEEDKVHICIYAMRVMHCESQKVRSSPFGNLT